MSYKDRYADAIEEQFRDLENRIMSDVIRRIRKTGEITSTADWQINRLRELGYSSEYIEKFIMEALNATWPEMFELYDKVVDWEYVRNKKIYEQINAEFIPYDNNEQLKQWVEAVKQQTAATLQNFTRTMGIVEQINGQLTYLPLTDFYRKTLDAAIMDITSGAFDYNSTLRKVVNTLTRSGIRTIDYTSGYSSRLPVAARRAVMTGITQLTGQINEYNADKLGTEYFEVEWHANARPSHRVWQGKVWTKDQLVGVCGLGTVTGLCGANCYHTYYPFFPGLSERNWTDEWLREQNAAEDEIKTFRGKEYTGYEATQKQRQMETSMRAQRQKVRLLEQGGADKADITIAKARYQGQLNEYREFSDAMGLEAQMERVYIDGLGRVAPGKSPITVVNRNRNVIMNQARGSGAFQSLNMRTLTSDTDISIDDIQTEMDKSPIGKEVLEQIEKSADVRIQVLQGVRAPNGERGSQQGSNIVIYLDEIANVRVAAQTVIHEMTHFYYDIGYCQWAEAVCFAKEKMHIEGRNKLTLSELRYIVKLTKDNYPELEWKKGGYKDGKPFSK